MVQRTAEIGYSDGRHRTPNEVSLDLKHRKKRLHIVDVEPFCTAYQSRTDDLLRERQMSWTTRRMRLL